MRLRRLALFLVALLTCLFGMGVDVAELSDGFQAHVVCPEGGEILHLAPNRQGPHRREITNADPTAHDKGCLLAEHGLLPSPVLVTAPSVTVLASVPVPALLAAAALDPPGRPPLVNAPKTSPPAVV
jgi:hypothetical protein